MKQIIIVILFFLSLNSIGQVLFDAQLKLLYKNTVPQIKAKDVYSKLNQKEKIYLLDSRSSAEYKVSHIAGAQFVNYDTFSTAQVKNIPNQAMVVVYCAVGVRSERVGEQLLKAGYKKVYNLYGGIFSWKNEGYPVYNSRNKTTDSVHTYNRAWAIWLRKGIKVYE